MTGDQIPPVGPSPTLAPVLAIASIVLGVTAYAWPLLLLWLVAIAIGG